MTTFEIIDELIMTGEIYLDKSGNTKVVLLSLNDKDIQLADSIEFSDLLEDNNLYENGFVCVIVSADYSKPYSPEWLPIFGENDTYITTRLFNDKTDAIKDFIQEIGLDTLVRRINYYERYNIYS